MGQWNVVSGFIHEDPYRTLPDQIVESMNDAALARLPDQDAYPPLTRDLFFLPPKDASPRPYRGRTIAIAWSSSAGLEDFEAWRTKLEALLREMIWDHALVTVTTESWGDFVMRWDALRTSADDASPVAAWKTKAWQLDTAAPLESPKLGFDG